MTALRFTEGAQLHYIDWRNLATILAAAVSQTRSDPVGSRIFDVAREQALKESAFSRGDYSGPPYDAEAST